MEACHRRAIEEKFLFQRAADGLDDVSLDLIHYTVGVDDLPAIVQEEKTLHADFPVPPIDLDFGYRTDISGRREIFDIADASSSHDINLGIPLRRGPSLPLSESGQTHQKLGAARIIEIAKTKIEWVGTDESGQLIDEAFIGESVLHATWRPDPGPAEWRLGEEMRYGLNAWEGVGDRRGSGQVIRVGEAVRLSCRDSRQPSERRGDECHRP